MKFDLRLPIGIMFSLFGAMLVIFGAVSDKDIYEQHSLGINVNLAWGTVLLAFGIFMLFLTWNARAKAAPPPGPDDKRPE